MIRPYVSRNPQQTRFLRPSPQRPKSMDAIMGSLRSRRGFIFQASDIYGGINGFWDYGPHAQLKKTSATRGGKT